MLDSFAVHGFCSQGLAVPPDNSEPAYPTPHAHTPTQQHKVRTPYIYLVKTHLHARENPLARTVWVALVQVWSSTLLLAAGSSWSR